MQVVLVMFRPDGSRRSFSLARDLTIIGRGEDCDLRIPLGEVSRKHARLAKDGDTLHLEDLGSSNGTYVNGERIQESSLNGGDILAVGPLTFVVQINGFPADEDITPPIEPAAAGDETVTAGHGAPPGDEAIQANTDDVVELEEAHPEPAGEGEAPAGEGDAPAGEGEPLALEEVPLEEVQLEEVPDEAPAPPPPLPPAAAPTRYSAPKAPAPPPLPPAAQTGPASPPPPPLPPGVAKFEPAPVALESAPEDQVLDPDLIEVIEEIPAEEPAQLAAEAEAPAPPPVPAADVKASGPNPATDPAIAFVLPSSQRLPDIKEILAAAKSQLRGQSFPKTVAWQGGNLVIPAGPYRITVSLMPAPYPWADLEGPAATSWWWPEATEKLQPLQNHFIVSVLGGEMDPIERRILLTHLVRAVVKTTDAVGVNWAEGTLVHEAAKFLEQSSGAAADNPPASLWIDVRIEQNEDNSYRCFTTGMSKLGFMEIEIPTTSMEPGDLYAFVGDTAQYILANRIHIQPGETMGRSEEHQFQTLHTPSMYNRGTVLSLVLP